MADLVATELNGGVQTITLDNPGVLNALSNALLDQLSDVLRAAERDSAIRALVITGAGAAFSSGADIREFELTEGPDGTRRGPSLGDLLSRRVNPLILRLRRLPKPVLAAVNGVAAGAGMSLALACDLRVAAESARFAQSFSGIALVPDAGSSYFLPRLVGPARALELAWTARQLGAREAYELGIVERVVPDAELRGAIGELAAQLADGPSQTIALTKRLLSQSHEQTLERMLELEAGYQEIASRSPDFAEGVAAFREKRRPRFGPGKPTS